MSDKIKIHVRLAREQTYEEHEIRLEPKITLIFWAPGERNAHVVVRCCHVWPTLLHVYKPWSDNSSIIVVLPIKLNGT